MELNFKNYQQLSLLSSLSLLFGFLMGKSVQHREYLTADAILASVKQAFRREATIEGAWINQRPKRHAQFAIHTMVYTGGLSRYEDGQLVQYEFMADAKTGSILKINRL
ncbi:hypothetical protein FD04_GL000880 [Secundilactobacillus odoratitofui DSM 19909 = JCM 15043]|uniref:PepSY domain-containing protein n=1 Tax=Secundilactobacillus odoratitofui DSM 19909 = JCM 15043 TaxID=1423776 RepID=A0A0R1LWB2_9LACO|nr:hypothetical protein [Secundilactobacillus odoratitofui]KRK97907.1 hypothetical protein FD04_GL000880 [Secundilactobacillus odoratitofui DSM 19909 = JCM 15043]